MNINIKLHKNDLPDNVKLKGIISSDAEFLGLTPPKDKLCLIQINEKDSNDVHVVQLDRRTYVAPNLVKLRNDRSIKKIFHYARKDMEMIKYFLKVDVENVECTKEHCWFPCMMETFLGIESSTQDSLSRCLACDEKNCGPAFASCAGMTRRRAGILTDISRNAKEVCSLNFTSNGTLC